MSSALIEVKPSKVLGESIFRCGGQGTSLWLEAVIWAKTWKQEGASQVKIWGRISFLEVRVAWRGTAWLGSIEWWDMGQDDIRSRQVCSLKAWKITVGSLDSILHVMDTLEGFGEGVIMWSYSLIFKDLSSHCVEMVHRQVRGVGRPLGRCCSNSPGGRHDGGGAWIRVIVARMGKVGDSVCILKEANRPHGLGHTETLRLTWRFWLEPLVGRWCHLQRWGRNRKKLAFGKNIN